MDAYTEAHLFVAAIRVLTHKHSGPPALGDVCELLDFSEESGHAISRNLKKMAIIDTAEDPFSIKLSVADHQEIEKIPQKEQQKNSLADELARFQEKKQTMDKKVANIQEELDQKKKQMYADLDAKLKEGLNKYKKE